MTPREPRGQLCIWTGVDPDVEVMREALEEYLEL